MSEHYILEGKEPKRGADLLTWSKWFETADRHVAKTEIAPGVEISTVFLGLDHSFGGGAPILFKTMGFSDYGGDEIVGTRRYCTWAEAELGHMEVVEEAMRKLGISEESLGGA